MATKEITAETMTKICSSYADILSIDDFFAIERGFDSLKDIGSRFYLRTNAKVNVGVRPAKSIRTTWVSFPKQDDAYGPAEHSRLMQAKPYCWEFWA